MPSPVRVVDGQRAVVVGRAVAVEDEHRVDLVVLVDARVQVQRLDHVLVVVAGDERRVADRRRPRRA